ncbi:MAG TPA: SLC13 family permease, partial [Terracidiphilus sp.]
MPIAPHDIIKAWSIVGLATAGGTIRPFRVPEAIWAVAGASALVLFGILPWSDAVAGMRKGFDIYLFLIGMMLIAELARLDGLFDYLAALAVEHAHGSPQRLFLLIYHEYFCCNPHRQPRTIRSGNGADAGMRASRRDRTRARYRISHLGRTVRGEPGIADRC